jgi:hypothetical protein
MLGALRASPTVASTLPGEVLDDVGSYLDSWANTANADDDGTFRWRADIPVDELVYLTNALYNLDQCLSDDTHGRSGMAQPTEGRAFHVVLVEALLFALTQEGPCQAEFAGQLRPWWSEVIRGSMDGPPGLTSEDYQSRSNTVRRRCAAGGTQPPQDPSLRNSPDPGFTLSPPEPEPEPRSTDETWMEPTFASASGRRSVL